MSRIAKNPIVIPQKVEAKLEGNVLKVKGPLGSLEHTVHPKVAVLFEEEANQKLIKFSYADADTEAKANAGTTRALANNMVKGVSEGFKVELELVGVGYRAQAQGKALNLTLGFSHPVSVKMPEGVTAETPSNTAIILKSADKQLLMQTAANIRAIRPPEPYKGKGVRYATEHVKIKETKKK